jgi:hypothetical protein
VTKGYFYEMKGCLTFADGTIVNGSRFHQCFFKKRPTKDEQRKVLKKWQLADEKFKKIEIKRVPIFLN